MLHRISEAPDADNQVKQNQFTMLLSNSNKSQHQAVAVIGIALISMGEDLGAEMALRTFDHILQYGEPVIKQAIPLALGLISVCL